MDKRKLPIVRCGKSTNRRTFSYCFFDDKNVTYKKDGFKEQAYSLKGMSGGAFFHGPNSFVSKPQYLSDIFKFVGIELEHHAPNKIVKGASAELVTALIDAQLVQT